MSVEPRAIGGGVRIANKAGCAEFFDVSMPTVDAWIRRGMPIVQKGGKGVSWQIDLLAAAQWRFGVQASGGSIDPESLEPMQRRAWYEGETKRRELQVRDRELIPAADVERVVATAFAALSSDIRAIPDNLERRHGIAGDVAEKVSAALDEAMQSTSERLAELAPVGDEVSA